jgi:diguanylate cyclase (GGDEF)-like protein
MVDKTPVTLQQVSDPRGDKLSSGPGKLSGYLWRPFKPGFLARFGLAKQLMFVGILASLVGYLGGAVGMVHLSSIVQDFQTYETKAGEALLAAEIDADTAKTLVELHLYLIAGNEEHLRNARQLIADIRKHVHRAGALADESWFTEKIIEFDGLLDDFESDMNRVVVLKTETDRIVAEILDKLGPKIRALLTAAIEESTSTGQFELAAKLGMLQEDFLTARLYIFKLLNNRDYESVRKIEAEFNEVEPALATLSANMASSQVGRTKLAERLGEVRELLNSYRGGFAKFHTNFMELQSATGHLTVDDSKVLRDWTNAIKEEATALESKLQQNTAQSLSYAQKSMPIAIALALMASIAVSLAYARKLAAAVTSLTAGMRTLAAGDTAIIMTGQERGDEVGEMAKALAVFKSNALEKSRIASLAENQRQQIEAERLKHSLEQEHVVSIIGEGLRGIVTGNLAGRIESEVAPQYVGLKEDFNASVEQLEAHVAERERIIRRLDHIAGHDPLTDLANRALLLSYLDSVLSNPLETGSTAFHILDLDGFKAVNDTLGHFIGDCLLKEVAARLSAAAAEQDMVARLGGDEFALVQANIRDATEVHMLAHRIIAAVSAPFMIEGHCITIGASVGIALAPVHGTDHESLFRNADLALYHSKKEGRCRFSFFEFEMLERVELRRATEQSLRGAILNDELLLFFQPLVGVEENSVVGFEALVRWNHPQRGLLSPAEFIEVAEETGLILAIGDWVLRKACAVAMTWPKGLKVAVNVSAHQLKQRGFAETVVLALGASGLSPHRLEIEITESAVVETGDAVPKMLQQLRALGVRVVLDDFGTGYSSLNYLRNFPVDKIKIDRSFIVDLEAGGDDALAIVKSIIGIASALHMSVLAEGIETSRQAEIVCAAGVTEMQGFLFSKPVPAHDLEKFYKTQGGHLNGSAILVSPARIERATY